MAHTSEETLSYANEQVTPFFTRAQLYAFSIAPTNDAIEQVNKGGKQQDYLPIEYVRSLLDRFIGAGRWEIQAVLQSADKEIVQKYEGKGENRKPVDRVAATAIVNVSISVLARDGSTQRLTHAAVGTNTQYAGLDAGYGSIIGNAIKSAESDGVRRAAQNFGKAFGFDLKGKISRDTLPPGIAYYAKMLDERNDQKRIAAPIEEAEIAEEAPNAQEASGAPTKSAEAVPASTPGEVEGASAKTAKSTTPPVKTEAAAAKPAEVEPAKVGEVKTAAVDAPAAVAATPETAAAPAASEDWELSMTPSKYEEWLRCLQTMSKRVANMTTPREIDNFLKRNAKLIGALPILPSEGERSAKDFKARWRKVVSARYIALEADVPPPYRDEPLADAA